MRRIEFDNPQMLGGEKRKNIELREPLFKDVRMVSKVGDEIEMQNQLIRRLSGIDTITDEEFDNMPYAEYKKIAEVIEGFM